MNSRLGFIMISAALLGLTSCGSKTNEQAVNEFDTAETPELEEVAVGIVDSSNTESGEMSEGAEEYTITPSGLKYKVLRQGNGRKPAATDQVTVHYEGKLTDGTVFDSSYQRGTPATFPLNAVIKGWTEGLQLMPEGSIYELYIPYDLAYGEMGIRGSIPPKADLIFKVELISVE